MRFSVLALLVLVPLVASVHLRGPDGGGLAGVASSAKAGKGSFSAAAVLKKFFAPGCASVKTRTCRGCVKAGCAFWRHVLPEGLRQDKVYDKCAPANDKAMMKLVEQQKFHIKPAVTEDDCAAAARTTGSNPFEDQKKRNDVNQRIAARVAQLNVGKAKFKRIPCDETLMNLVLERERIDDVTLAHNPYVRIANIMREHLTATRTNTKIGGALSFGKELATSHDIMAAAQLGFNAATSKLRDLVAAKFEAMIADASAKSRLMDESRVLCLAADCVNNAAVNYVEVLDAYGDQYCTMTCTPCPKFKQVSSKFVGAAKALAPACQPSAIKLNTVELGKILFDFAREYVAATA